MSQHPAGIREGGGLQLTFLTSINLPGIFQFVHTRYVRYDTCITLLHSFRKSRQGLRRLRRLIEVSRSEGLKG